MQSKYSSPALANHCYSTLLYSIVGRILNMSASIIAAASVVRKTYAK